MFSIYLLLLLRSQISRCFPAFRFNRRGRATIFDRDRTRMDAVIHLAKLAPFVDSINNITRNLSARLVYRGTGTAPFERETRLVGENPFVFLCCRSALSASIILRRTNEFSPRVNHSLFIVFVFGTVILRPSSGCISTPFLAVGPRSTPILLDSTFF